MTAPKIEAPTQVVLLAWSDAAGKLVPVSADAAGNLVPGLAAPVSVAATLAIANDACTIAIGALGASALQLLGTWTGVVSFEGSVDGGTTWNSVGGMPISGGASVSSATANGVWEFPGAGLTHLRARLSTATSGSVLATAYASNGTRTVRINNLALGSSGDALATDTTSSWSMVALLKGLLALVGFKADAADTHTDTTAISAMSVWKQISKSVQAATPAGTNTIGATMDAGPSWTTVWGIVGVPFTSADQHSAAASVTDAPTSGQKLVIDDILVSVDTAMWVTFKCETTAVVIAGPFYLPANGSLQITPRGKGKKLATADKKLQVITSVAGNIMVDVGYHSEA